MFPVPDCISVLITLVTLFEQEASSLPRAADLTCGSQTSSISIIGELTRNATLQTC